jgi:hypothetical protein
MPLPAGFRRPRAEHAMTVVAGVALTVLVILPVAALLPGSVAGDGGLTLGHFREALSGRLYVQALRNSLVLGAWMAVLEPPPGNPPLSQIKLWPIDHDAIEKESKSLKNRFNEIFQ